MKRKVFSVLIAMVLVLASAGSCFASVEIDDNYNSIYAARGATYTGGASYTDEEDMSIYYSTDLEVNAVDVDTENKHAGFEITPKEDAALGTHMIMLRGTTSDSFQFIQVFVVDFTAPVIKSVKKATTTSIKVTWGATDVGRYKLQYKVAGGSWKTAVACVSGTSYTVKNLTKGKKYYFRVCAVNHEASWGDLLGDYSTSKSLTLK